MTLLNILLDGEPITTTTRDGGMSMIIMVLLMVVVLYFFMIRPQQKRQKELDQFRSKLGKGDKVMTVGGIHGTVVTVTETTVVILIAEGVEISVEKSCVVADSTFVNNNAQPTTKE